MPIQLSPSVVVQERDLTNVIPAVSASIGATIVDAAWGPVMEVTTIDSENALVSRFGKPNGLNATSWFTAANFLAYSNNLLVVRTKTPLQTNAIARLGGSVTGVTVNAGGSGYTTPTITFSEPTGITIANGGIQATGTVTVVGGEITAVTITNPGFGYTVAPSISVSSGGSANFTVTIGEAGVAIDNADHYDTSFTLADYEAAYGEFAAKYPGSLGNSLAVSYADSSNYSNWAYKSMFTAAPGTSSYASNVGGSNDEMHLVVVDMDGLFTGTPGTVLEQYEFLSKAADGKFDDGSTSFYKTVLNQSSKYVWWLGYQADKATSWGKNAAGVGFANVTGANGATVILSGGKDDYSHSNAVKQNAFDMFKSDEEFDLSLIMCGKADSVLASYIVQNVAEYRKDCVAFISPQNTSGGNPLIGNDSSVATNIIGYRNALTVSSSYMVVDSGYKYQYDRYNDAYRWVPLNGDIAGLCARTDETNDPWFSPAGLNRGQIKNVVRLAYNPRKADRDNLYVAGVNPVVSFPGQGVVLFGDKTGLKKPSAFDRINVRRLFIVLEKAIATAAKYQLFEFNDGFTRAQFRNIVEPFLRDVKGRRGVTDFRVVCDESNNTAEVIDTNRFVADIYIKPARSINFIQLNFIATRTGAEFNEIAG